VGCWAFTFGANAENMVKHKIPIRITIFLLLILLMKWRGWCRIISCPFLVGLSNHANIKLCTLFEQEVLPKTGYLKTRPNSPQSSGEFKAYT
jgi:hypothetical protein